MHSDLLLMKFLLRRFTLSSIILFDSETNSTHRITQMAWFRFCCKWPLFFQLSSDSKVLTVYPIDVNRLVYNAANKE